MAQEDLMLNISYEVSGNNVNKKKRKNSSDLLSPKKVAKNDKTEINNASTDRSGSLVSLVRGARKLRVQHQYEPDGENIPLVEKLFSSTSYGEAGVHPYLVSNLEQNFGITQMTEVQRLSIPELLGGCDALIRSQTGSGKTLAYAIPIIQNLQEIRPKISRSNGIRALIVLPTRELAVQTYECLVKLVRSFAWLVPGILVGGEKRKSEKARLRKGITILVGTPGRLLDHIKNTKTVSLASVSWLVLDEADRLLDLGYEEDITQLTKALEEQRVEGKQTVLLSATLTPQVERLAGLTLSDPKHIDTSEEKDTIDHMVIPKTLQQFYLLCPARLRLVTLSSVLVHFIKVKEFNKVLIFMATQDMVDYYTALFSSGLGDVASFFKLHGNMSQLDRTEVFKKFRSCESGVLICTDVAARGLDLPKVTAIVQYTAPCTPADYVHRVGRTARVGNSGTALLMLAPTEMPFIEMLSNKRIQVKEKNLAKILDSLFEIDMGEKEPKNLEDAASSLQLKYEQAVLEDDELHKMAATGYKSFVRFYATYPKDSIAAFNFKALHLGHYAKSFALRDAPTKIQGIGKPKFKNNNRDKRRDQVKDLTKKTFRKEFQRPLTETVSEYDSGMKF